LSLQKPCGKLRFSILAAVEICILNIEEVSLFDKALEIVLGTTKFRLRNSLLWLADKQ